MGYKEETELADVANVNDNNEEAPIGMPPQILMKVSWSKQLKFLTVEDKASVFTNIFNYYTGDDLVEMNPVAEMFFATATELFDYNINKYEETVKLNRIKGKKGGRPPNETRNNPTGLLENPNNLKEKVKDKAKEIKSRFPEFDITGWEELEFDKLPKEAKKYNVFWDFITGPKLDALIKKVTSEFSTQENPLNWKEEDGRLVFPPDINPNFNQIKKTVDTVMKNAGVPEKEYKIKPEDIKGSSLTKQEPSSPQPSAADSSKVTFKVTLDPKKVRGNTEPVKKMIAGLKATYDKNFEYSNSVITIKNIAPEKKIDLIRFFAPYRQTEVTESLDFDFDRYQMLRRAGIIK